MTGCSPLQKVLGLGGPSITADTQIGKVNTQTVGTTTVRETRGQTVTQTEVTNKLKTEGAQKVVVNEAPFWVVLLAVIGWLLPSPNEMIRWVTKQKR